MKPGLAAASLAASVDWDKHAYAQARFELGLLRRKWAVRAVMYRRQRAAGRS